MVQEKLDLALERQAEGSHDHELAVLRLVFEADLLSKGPATSFGHAGDSLNGDPCSCLAREQNLVLARDGGAAEESLNEGGSQGRQRGW